jgi:hypothetical protein
MYKTIRIEKTERKDTSWREINVVASLQSKRDHVFFIKKISTGKKTLLNIYLEKQYNVLKFI